MFSKSLIPTNKNQIKLYPFNYKKTPIQEIFDNYITEKEKEFKTKIPYHIENEYIPEDPIEFYKDFGYVLHPETNEPIKELTPYQNQIWKSKAKTKVVVKPQKSGITTSVLLEDFQTAITKGRGKDILVVAQTKDMATEHLYTLKRMIVDSEKYRKYLITESKELYFREEKTKVSVIFLKNPDNPFRPTRIIAVGFSHRQLWSWKNVYRIHMSDVVTSEVVDDEPVYAAAKSRLANTNGYWVIESPPKGVNNYYYRIYDMYKDNTDPNVQVFIVDIEDAIKYKITTRDFIESERKRLGFLFAQFYGSSFIEAQGNLFSIESINKAVEKGSLYDPEVFRPTAEKYMSADIGFESSKFAVLVAEWDRAHRHLRILHSEEMQSPLFEQAIDRILELRKQYGNVVNIAIDATSRQEFCTALKIKINDYPYHWHKVKEKMNECKIRNTDIEKRMTVVPILFNTESKLKMSQHVQQLLDDSKELVCINPKFDKLITSLKGAVFDDRGMLDKEASPNDDLLDSFMMICQFIKFK